MTISALVSLALAQYLHLPLPLWAVLTAVIVTQINVGRSLRATFDYLVGTLGGAIYGGAIGVLIPHSSEIALLAVLALAVAPLAFVAALNPKFAAAPITAIIVLFNSHNEPNNADRFGNRSRHGGGARSCYRVGCLVRPMAVECPSAARWGGRPGTLDRMARALGELLAGLSRGLDVNSLHRIQDGLGEALVQMSTVSAEVDHERSAGLAVGPDTGPLLRTLVRLRHDLVMIGRAAVSPLPEAFGARLEMPLVHVGTALADYLRASGSALRAARHPPSLDAVESALGAFAAEVAALRRDGLTRSLPGDEAERFFALGFALEQMHGNLKDLERCVADRAGSAKGRSSS